MALSTLRMPRCSSKPRSRSWASAIRNQLTEEQYRAVLKVLRDQHSLIHRYWR